MEDNLTFEFGIKQEDKHKLNGHRSVVVWFMGLSGSGKSSLSNKVEQGLFQNRINTTVLDGDKLRKGLNSDLGFSVKDRDENIRRASELSKILMEEGKVVISSFITPFEKQRTIIKSVVGNENLILVYVNTPLEVCIERDKKGLYKKALNGDIQDFTGISHPFEPPQNPDIEVNYPNDLSKISKKVIELIMKKIEL